MSSTPDRIPKPRTAPPLTPAGKAHKFQLHIVHTLMGNSYLIFKDLQEDIKSGFLKEILELPGKEGEPISRCYGAVLSWTALPGWNNSKLVWRWQDPQIEASDLKEFLESLAIFDKHAITESSDIPELCFRTPESQKAMLRDRVDALGLDSIENLSPQDDKWLHQLFGMESNVGKCLEDASGNRKRAFTAASGASSAWAARKKAAANNASASASSSGSSSAAAAPRHVL